MAATVTPSPHESSPSGFDLSCRMRKASSSLQVTPQTSHPSNNSVGGGGGGGGSSALASLARGSLVMGLSTDNAPVVRSARVLDSNASSTSLGLVSNNSGANTPMGESSNMIIGPDGVLVPRSSILLNPPMRKTFVDEWRVAPNSTGSVPGPTVLRIAAVPTEKDRERERERERQEREREIEREWREKEQAERVWGIPKKAFYLGLGEINFNAQMAMLGGWGNGSGGFPETASTPPSTTTLASTAGRKAPGGHSLKKKQKKRRGSTGTITAQGKDRTRSSGEAVPSNIRKAGQQRPSSSSGHLRREPSSGKDQHEDAESDNSMDLEELAALNAIINTRRSMEAAQKLANPTRATSLQTPPVASRRDTSARDGPLDGVAPSQPSGADRQASLDSVPTIMTASSSGMGLVADEASDRTDATAMSGKSINVRRFSELVDYPSSRVRFAPLPFTYVQSLPDGTTIPAGLPLHELGLESGSSRLIAEDAESKLELEKASASQHGMEDLDSDEAEEEDGYVEGDESWSRRLSGGVMKGGKWYLMGMPKSVFTPQYYRASRRPTSSGGMLELNAGSETQLSSSPSNERRMSAGTLGTVASSTTDGERRGRVRSRGRRPTSSRASSVKSRSSSVGSFDEDDRERRRQLIRASRPGGTGMVTLPDGRKVRARRVGEEYSDEDEADVASEWGFGRIARAAERRTSFGDIEPSTGDKRTSDEEGGRESDFDGSLSDTFDASQESSSLLKRPRREQTTVKEKPSPKEGNAELTVNSADRAGRTSPETGDTNGQTLRKNQSSHAKAGQEADKKDSESENQPAPRQPKRALTLPTGPIALSASQAAEVRRRHEEEVAALGAEVLNNLAKAKKARQAQQDGSAQTAQSPSPHASTASPQQASDARGQQHLSRVHNTSSPSSIPASPKSSQLPSLPSSELGNADRGRARARPSRTYSLDDSSKLPPMVASVPGKTTSPLRHPLRSAKGRMSSMQAVSRSGFNLERQTSHEPTSEAAGRLAVEPLQQMSSTVDDADNLSKTPRLRVSTPPRVESRSPVDAESAMPSPVTKSSVDREEDAGDLTTSVSSLRTLRGQLEEGLADGPSLASSPLAHSRSSLDRVPLASPTSAEVPGVREADSVAPIEDDPLVSSPASIRRSLSSNSRHSTKQRHRTSNVPDLPSPWNLPRRPDARGYAVVPLPAHQLGRRPLRPQEGRFWQSDEEEEEEEAEEEPGKDDEGDGEVRTDSEAEDAEIVRQNPSSQTRPRHIADTRTPSSGDAGNDSDEDDESDLDAEQLAEEERRTAVQKKRATTRAAGAELVSGLGGKHKGQSTSAAMSGRTAGRQRAAAADRLSYQGRSRSSTSLGKTAADEMPIGGEYNNQQGARYGRASRSGQATASGHLPLNGEHDGHKVRPALSTSVLSTARDSRGHSVARISRRRDTWNDFEEPDDGANESVSAQSPRSVLQPDQNEDDTVDLSDVDDLWPPTLVSTLGGSVSPLHELPLSSMTMSTSPTAAVQRPSLSNKRLTSSASTLSVYSAGQQHAHSPSSVSTAAAQQLAAHAAKARIVRERREKKTKEREREMSRKQREMDESLDYGWPRSLAGSSLY